MVVGSLAGGRVCKRCSCAFDSWRELFSAIPVAVTTHVCPDTWHQESVELLPAVPLRDASNEHRPLPIHDGHVKRVRNGPLVSYTLEMWGLLIILA